MTGFQTEAQPSSCRPSFIFSRLWSNIREIRSRGFGPFFRNSIIASLVSTAIVLVLAVPCRLRAGAAADEEVEGHALLLHLDQVPAAGRHHRAALHHLRDLASAEHICRAW